MYVIPGTPGNPDWIYPNLLPIVKGQFVFDPDTATEADGTAIIIDKLTSSQIEEMGLSGNISGAVNRLESILRNQGKQATTYKLAIFSGVSSSSIYANVSGSIVQYSSAWGKVADSNYGWNGWFHFGEAQIVHFLSSTVNDLPFFNDLVAMETYLKAEGEDVRHSDDTGARGDYDGFFEISANVIKAHVLNNTNFTYLSQILALGDRLFTNKFEQSILGVKLFRTPGTLPIDPADSIVVQRQILTSDPIIVNGKRILKQGKQYDFGTFDFKEDFNSFLDYTDTQIKIYLPYSGIYSLDPAVVMGGTVHLYGIIDFISGTILYYLSVENPGVTYSDANVLYSWTGSVAVDVPLTSGDFGDKISSLFSGTLSLASSTTGAILPQGALASTGIEAGLKGTVQVADSIVQSFTQQSTANIMSGCLQSFPGMGAVQYPYIIVTRSIPQYYDNYNHVVGKPCMKYLPLSSLSGYTEITQIELDGLGLTAQEESILINQLQSGVYL